jgi:lysophospholipase L1-like esterase
VVRTSIGGSRARLVVTNEFGTEPLTIGAAHVALRVKDATIDGASDRALSFGGRPTTTIPAGAVIVSDPVDFAVPNDGDVIVDLYLPGDTNTPSPLTQHGGAFQTSYVSETGNFAGRTPFPVVATVRSWFVLSRLEVNAPASVSTVVAFGDSITDGARSTLDTNHRWPSLLAARLVRDRVNLAVVNAGIGGNRLLSNAAFGSGVNALARFDRDALDQPGVTDVIVLEGINDIGNARQSPSPTAKDLIAAQQQMIEQAHTRGIRIYGGTLTPFEGAAYFTAEGEAKRQALNDWIRHGHGYDGVIDFEAAVRDPEHPTRFQSRYDSGDHLHPNDAGYEAMAAAIDPKIFQSTPTRAGTR